jgi:uncharacterized protein YcfJ
MRTLLIAATLAAFAFPAVADPPPWAPAHGRRAKEAEARAAAPVIRDSAARAIAPSIYDSAGRYAQPVALTRDDQIWRGSDGAYHCRRSNGTTGLVIGAALGGLLGHELDGGRHHTVGTLVGAAAGGLLGREIDRGRLRCQ